MPKNQKKNKPIIHRVMCDAPKCRQKAMVSMCYDHYNKLLNNTITQEEKLMLERIRAASETAKQRELESTNRLMDNGFAE